MKNNKKIIFIIAILTCFSISCIGGVIAFAYAFKQREIAGESKVGHCEINSIYNPTAETKLLIGDGEEKPFSVLVMLDCNIDAVVRVKITPKYFDKSDRTIIMPNNVIYNTDSSQGNWMSNDFNICFYFDASVKNVSTLKFTNSISFRQENINEYQDLSISFIIEADILQTGSIDYNNHPWADSAPLLWLEKVKNI